MAYIRNDGTYDEKISFLDAYVMIDGMDGV